MLSVLRNIAFLRSKVMSIGDYLHLNYLQHVGRQLELD